MIVLFVDIILQSITRKITEQHRMVLFYTCVIWICMYFFCCQNDTFGVVYRGEINGCPGWCQSHHHQSRMNNHTNEQASSHPFKARYNDLILPRGRFSNDATFDNQYNLSLNSPINAQKLMFSSSIPNSINCCLIFGKVSCSVSMSSKVKMTSPFILWLKRVDATSLMYRWWRSPL